MADNKRNNNKSLVNQRSNEPIMDEDKKELFHKFISIQERQIELQFKKFELQEKELNKNAELAKHSLECEGKDRKEERSYKFLIRLSALIFSAVVVTFLLVFLGYALYIDKADVVYKILDYLPSIIMSAATGFSGYFFGRIRKSDISSKKQDNEE